MEVQMAAARGTKSVGGSTPPHHHGGGAKAVPGYLRPSAGSCHHVCKYGGTHAFEEKEPPPHYGRAPPKPRKQKQPPVSDGQRSVLVKVRSVFRRRAGDSSSRAEKAAAAGGKAREAEGVEWKDIVAYDSVPAHGSSQITGSGNGDEKNATTKGKKKKSRDKAYVITDQHVTGVKGQDGSPEKKPAKPGGLGSKLTTAKVSTEPPPTDKEESASPPHKNSNADADADTKSVKPPKGKKPAALLHVEKMATDQDMVHGYQIISPSLLQNRAILLRDLEKEMADEEAAAVKQGKTPACSFDQEEYDAAAAAESSGRPIPAHRRVKSMGISSRSTRQGSRSSSAAFKLRSRSTRATPAALPSEEEKPARLRSRRGGEDPVGSSSTGRGIQLRIRSLRRRGVGGAGFTVPAVALRHQKTLEKKRSQRLYNNLIEETASKLVKSRKSRVKALVGAFESVISRIAK